MNQPRQCPKCHYIRNDGDALVLASICPACGIVYQRFAAQSESLDLDQSSRQTSDQSSSSQRKRLLANRTQSNKTILECLLPSSLPPIATQRLAAYCVVYVGFFIWGWHFILTGLSIEPIMGSFMHLVNLPFHEFGHVLFIPFGQFMTILGGSLFQLALPFGLTLVFLFKQRNPFAASITLWWCGQSFIDLSPYIADASFRSLPLIAGLGEESHDWGNLLTQLGWLQYDVSLAKASFAIGSILILLSLLWGALVLVKQFGSQEKS